MNMKTQPRTAGRRYTAIVFCLAIVTFAVGCGPIQSTSRISDAEVSMERARVAEAETRAPYEFYSAYHYLYKAKEEEKKQDKQDEILNQIIAMGIDIGQMKADIDFLKAMSGVDSNTEEGA